MRWRIMAGCFLAIIAIAIAGPPAWLPWGTWVRQHAPSWWSIPVLVAMLLLWAGRFLSDKPSGQSESRWWPTRHRGEHVALGLGLLLLLEPLLHLGVLAYLGNRPAPGAEDILFPQSVANSTTGLIAKVLVLCILAPIAEEWFFRGRLLPWLARVIGPWGAISATSLMFACAHGTPIACLVAAPIGVLLGWMRLYRNDLGACIMVHQAHNALFLFAGTTIVASPMTAMVLAGSGALMLTLAASQGPSRWRALPVGLGLAAALAVVMPTVLTLKDQLWVQAAARMLNRVREPWVGTIISRLDMQRWSGRLTGERARTLRETLDHAGGPAARAARMLLDGSNAQAASASEALADLRATALCQTPSERLCAAATAIGTAWPEALAIAAIEEPDLVATWLGPDGALHAITAAVGGARQKILRNLETAWPGRLASVLFRLPADQVTGLDRRHVRMHYSEAEAMIALLDPERKAAWMK
ncbi:MAG: CPBP family intramembrane glutamic endopeptidase [Planctomycetota bacterium]